MKYACVVHTHPRPGEAPATWKMGSSEITRSSRSTAGRASDKDVVSCLGPIHIVVTRGLTTQDGYGGPSPTHQAGSPAVQLWSLGVQALGEAPAPACAE